MYNERIIMMPVQALVPGDFVIYDEYGIDAGYLGFIISINRSKDYIDIVLYVFTRYRLRLTSARWLIQGKFARVLRRE
jgi:hypothetical protein